MKEIRLTHSACILSLFRQWIISELACYTYSMVVVPLYDTLGPDAIRFIINTGEDEPRDVLLMCYSVRSSTLSQTHWALQLGKNNAKKHHTKHTHTSIHTHTHITFSHAEWMSARVCLCGEQAPCSLKCACLSRASAFLGKQHPLFLLPKKIPRMITLQMNENWHSKHCRRKRKRMWLIRAMLVLCWLWFIWT